MTPVRACLIMTGLPTGDHVRSLDAHGRICCPAAVRPVTTCYSTTLVTQKQWAVSLRGAPVRQKGSRTGARTVAEPMLRDVSKPQGVRRHERQQ